MSSTDSATALRRIRGLLDKAEQTPFPDEAEAFANKASELMVRYRIDQAMLTRSQKAAGITESNIELGRGQYVRARLALLGEVSDAFGCRLLTSAGIDGRTGHLIGHPDDVEQVSMLYTSLLLQATRAVSHEAMPRGHNKIQFRRGFLLGFATRVGERLRAQVAESVKDAEDATTTRDSDTSVALVLADRSQQVDDWVKDRYGKLGHLGPAAPANLQGVLHGQEAGGRADLGGRSVPNPPATLGR